MCQVDFEDEIDVKMIFSHSLGDSLVTRAGDSINEKNNWIDCVCRRSALLELMMYRIIVVVMLNIAFFYCARFEHQHV